jgi:uncharacterized protein with HEPN domain
VSSKREQQRLEEIVEYIDKAEAIVGARTLAEFDADEVLVLAVERVLQIITEAAIKIGEARMTEIATTTPFTKIRGMGNILRHEYDGINRETIYRTVKDDLPPLRTACVRALDRQR